MAEGKADEAEGEVSPAGEAPSPASPHDRASSTHGNARSALNAPVKPRLTAQRTNPNASHGYCHVVAYFADAANEAVRS
jgi:hypothetical protein